MSAFFNTNILVYAFSTDAKRGLALGALASGGEISAQVLNEFTNVLRRKQKQEWTTIEAIVGALRLQFPRIVPITSASHAAALSLAREHGFSFYDALIVASAIEAGCDTLLSEDMQHGRRIAGLTIVDPFR